jgi:hypothetical protein
VNLRERRGFIIHPFTVPISTSAAQLTLEKDDYVIEPAFDFKQRAGYLSVAKNHRSKYNLRASYAFREVCHPHMPPLCLRSSFGKPMPVPMFLVKTSNHMRRSFNAPSPASLHLSFMSFKWQSTSNLNSDHTCGSSARRRLPCSRLATGTTACSTATR